MIRLRSRRLPILPPLALLGLIALSTPGCAGKKLEGQVLGTQTRLQDAIANGSKTIGCAPKETALAEANVKFAEEALKMGEYYRGKEHVGLSAKYTEIAELKTDPVRCRAPGQVVAAAQPTAKDKDGDGYDDDVDDCPESPEDFDGFEDENGCPDEDNDQDKVLDAAELVDGIWSNNDQKEGVDCRNDPEDIDEFEDEDGCPDPDNDKDGLIDHPEKIDQCPNEAEDFDKWEDEDGCPDPDNDQDTFLDGVDGCPNEPEDVDGDQDTDGCPDLAAKIDPCAIRLDGKIMFDSNKHDLESVKFRDVNHKLLDDLVTVLKNNPDITIEIGGHTDSKSSDSYNLKLSQRRVDSVRTYLINKGIKDTRVTAKGYGEAVPVDTNKTKEGRENNRRVEINRTDNPECNNTR
ncbi:OmpA family protein [Nannocystaceae bacterium ST9]